MKTVKIKVGDTVERITGFHQGMGEHDTAIVTKVLTNPDSVELTGYSGQHDISKLKIIKTNDIINQYSIY